MAKWYEFCNDSLEYKVGYYCAPVIIGIKTANTVTINADDIKKLNTVLGGTKLEYCVICKDIHKAVIMLYRRELLEKKLNDKVVHNLMCEFGYPDISLDTKLMYLCFRYTQYKFFGEEFPHELGLFLDYPPCDVLGFMEKNGQECLMCGYWKVYGDTQKAKEIFNIYDKARVAIMKALATGNRLNQINVCKGTYPMQYSGQL